MRGGATSLPTMLNALTHTQIYVLDQDQALDFYVGKLGLEVHTDVDLEFMRWLTISVPGEPEREILLSVPGPPGLDADPPSRSGICSARAWRAWRGSSPPTIAAPPTRSCSAQGVEFAQEPVERFYGIDCAIRDPFGNNIRITQPAPVPAD